MIGAGRMGQNHARMLAMIAETRLRFIVDHHLDRAKRVAGNAGCDGAADIEAVIGSVDAAIIATPTASHAQIAVPLLEAGIACLVEKPIATSPAQAVAIVNAAAAGGAALAIGHVERFNPAFHLATDLLAGRRVTRFEGWRLNPSSARIGDADVVSDLMVHDIDLAAALLGGLGTLARAEAPAGGHARDAALIDLAHAGGTRTRLLANRRTGVKMRMLWIETDEEQLAVDLLSRTVERRGPGRGAPLLGRHHADGEQPLLAELRRFVDGVRAGDPAPGVAADDAMAAMRIVWQAREALGI